MDKKNGNIEGKHLLQARRNHRRWVFMVIILGVLVTSGTFMALSRSAVARTYQKQVLDCRQISGTVSHVHNDDCYYNGELVCPLQEIPPHRHTSECWQEEPVLVCGLEENDGHWHTDDCFAPVMELACGMEESAGDETHPAHQHSPACYRPMMALVCGLEESPGDETHVGHRHTDACFEEVRELACGMEEGEGAHYHTDACWGMQNTLICGQAELPEHVHGPECFITEEMTPEELAARHSTPEPEETATGTDETNDTSDNAGGFVFLFPEEENETVDGTVTEEETAGTEESDPTVDVPEETPAAEPELPRATRQLGGEMGGATVLAEVPEGILNEYAQLSLADYSADHAKSVILSVVNANAAEGEERDISAIYVLDIGFTAGGEPSFPNGEAPIRITLRANEIRSMTAPKLFHLNNETAEQLTDAVFDIDAGAVTFSAYGFSPFAVVDLTGEDPIPEVEKTVSVSMPAMHFEAEAEGVLVTVDAPEGAFPKGTTMIVSQVEMDDDTLSNVTDAVESNGEQKVVTAQAIDISFFDADKNLIEPKLPIKVSMKSAIVSESENVALVHLSEAEPVENAAPETPAATTAEVVTNVQVVENPNEHNEIQFESDAFSVYVLVGTETITTNYITADGETYAITMTYGPEAMIPNDAVLEVREIPADSAEYENYRNMSEHGLDSDLRITFARFFDITIVKDGEEIQPQAAVEVTIEKLEELRDETTEEIKAVHFITDNSFQMINTTSTEEAVTFSADGFSVYGIVGTETISTQFITADGKTLSVTATFDARELLPKDAVLEVSEVTYEDDPDAYAKRNERLAEALFEKYGNVAITDARYLDISVMVPDESVGGDAKKEYEPVYPVKVKVDYTETMDTTNPGEYIDYNDGSTKVTPDIGNHIVGVHYTEDGAEFLETVDESTNTGVSETVTKTDSFSEYDFAYIYEYEIVDTDYDYEPSQISTMTLNTGISTKAAGSGMLRAAGDTPAHSKTLSDNHDGTHKLSLTVTGDADTDSNTASNANVIIVFDTSNSMINYYVPMANGARGSNNEDGSDSFVLYRNTSGTEADDGYTGTVYSRTRYGNRWYYSEYTGQRYSKTIRRADAAEKVLYDFAHALYGYQNTDDPSTPEDESKNIQTALITFNKTATTTQGWTSTETDITNKVSSTGAGGSKKLSNSSGTNWEDALRAAQTMVNSADNDPTFVVFITDGQPTQWHDYTSGYDTTGQGYVQSRDEARAVQLACAATGTDSHGALFGIYAYGTEADYLDELMYYAYTGTARAMDSGTVATDGYYNAADSSSLADAINDIFSKIVKTLGITGVSVNDGTTSQVQTTSGEISHLLEVDTSTYEYWLSFSTVDGKFTMKDLLSGNDIEYTVTSSGNNVTISWSKDGNNYSETYEGTYSAGTARIKWNRATSFYNYAPPTASFTNPSVDWDLSTVGTLLDGVTYEVTFDVYPSQYTLDLIAQMKNGEIKYSDLDSEVKKYLKEDYTLHTNTEANLTYTDSRNDQGEQTVPYVNPEPVSTNSEQLTINKEWKGGDPDTDSLPITVMMGGEEFHTSTLSAANNWSTDATISIGIIKNGQALSGAMGHDFSFAELDDTQYHWELDAPTVRPMLVNGTLTMLIKVDAKHPAPSGAVTYTIDGSTYYVDSSTTGLTATNIRRSYLDVIKTVTGANAPADAVFDFTMKVVNSRASTAGDPENLDSDYYVWFSVADSKNNYALVIDDNLVNGNVTRATDDAGAYTGYYYMPSGTEIHVNMKAGYSLRFLNLPSGSSYEVAESATMPNESFSFVSITGDGTVDPDNNQKMTGTIVTANNGYRVSVQNKYTAVDVQLKKVDDKNELLSGATFTLAKQKGTVWENIQEAIKPGDTATSTANPVDLGGLGVGKYRLTETKSPDGYIKLTSHIDFEVYKDGTVLAVKLAEGTTGAKIEKSGTEDAPVYTVIVENTPGEALPMTGGSGTLPYTLGGIALIMASALMYGFRMRRRERR